MIKLTENEIEKFAIGLFERLGYEYVYGPDIAPDSETPLPIITSSEVKVKA